MKRWHLLIASILALLVMVVIPMSIAAAGNGETANAASKPELKGALEIVAPLVVYPGKEFSLTVFLRKDQTPVEGVKIWVVSQDKAAVVKEAAKAMKEKGTGKVTVDEFQSVLESNAKKIGDTDVNGKLTATFNETGNYWLVAYKAGYVPDLSALLVRIAVVISGPEKASIGQSVTFQVSEKETGNPVAGIKVWALAKGKLPALRAALKAEFMAHKGDLKNADWAGIITSKAVLMGTTDQNGKLAYTFKDEGNYILVTALNGKLSGFGRITIESP
jgi:hypothetical protein